MKEEMRLKKMYLNYLGQTPSSLESSMEKKTAVAYLNDELPV